jgi:Sulphur transport
MEDEMTTAAHDSQARSPQAARNGLRISAVQTGVAAAVLAVAAGTWFEVRPPEAYGICMACHGRDLVDWIVNKIAGTRLEVAQASLVFPALTTIGALLGAFLGARTSGEFRWTTPEHPLKTFFYGVLVMNCALLAGGCSIRLLLRAGAGDALGVAGFAGMMGGVAIGTYWLRWRATR